MRRSSLTEAQAVAASHEVKISVLTVDNAPCTLAARDTRGLIKLVADAKTDRLLGGVIMAAERIRIFWNYFLIPKSETV